MTREFLLYLPGPELCYATYHKTFSARAFVHGLTSSQTALGNSLSLSPAERNRLIYLYVCSSKSDGGLGITPGAPDWPRVESVMLLHDQQWNDKWIKKWSTSLDVEASLDQLRAQVRHFQYILMFPAHLERIIIIVWRIGGDVLRISFSVPAVSHHTLCDRDFGLLLPWSVLFPLFNCDSCLVSRLRGMVEHR